MPTATELPIDTNASALQMAQTIFGGGMTILGASYSGDTRSSGTYSNGDTVSAEATPGDTGVILSTGRATDFTNSDGSTNTNTSASTSTNTQGVDNDADFNSLAGTQTYDASFLEIEFVPQGDLMTIDFVLSSEEYPEYIASNFNDVIGVWINGVQAEVSIGDGSASIGNINGGVTDNLYFDNTKDAYNTEMDGFTVTLTFVAPVKSGEVNTLKIGVADVGDSNYDTNLLIAGGSIQSNIVARDDEIELGTNDTKTLDVLSNDMSSGGALTITHIQGVPVSAGDSVTLGSGQIITLNPDGTLTVQSDSDGETVYFNYSVEDQSGNTDTGLVEITQIPCFTKGTLIDTPYGPVPIEHLERGMSVTLHDGAPQPIRWIGSRRVAATGEFRPVRLCAGQFGARRDLLVSPQHRILLANAWAELLYGTSEVLVKAVDLVNDDTIIRVNDMVEVTYFHLLFDRHQIVIANGVAAESYLPGPCTLPGFDAATQAEILRLFPQMDAVGAGYGPAARPILKRRECAPLMAAFRA
ncbi:Hint domain-containing protein [Arenibacterium halophilum]|uniref:Hint domain-containing protein n=1 Tax=Arenibacterium halophilum TaxID=2583821 RepID=A0ABY2XC36_9RHOB|nr:Hint domain-containing protein [Arenibacterium halophilum]TMV14519.1 Hint domain-containing protein [Arenibacterium halophilum]